MTGTMKMTGSKMTGPRPEAPQKEAVLFAEMNNTAACPRLVRRAVGSLHTTAPKEEKERKNGD